MKHDETYRLLAWWFERATTCGCHSLPIDKDIVLTRGGKSGKAVDTICLVAHISVALRVMREDDTLPEELWRCVCDEFNGVKRYAIREKAERNAKGVPTWEAREASRWLSRHYPSRQRAFAIINNIFIDKGLILNPYLCLSASSGNFIEKKSLTDFGGFDKKGA